MYAACDDGVFVVTAGFSSVVSNLALDNAVCNDFVEGF
jgi:hypothetical protein